MYRRESDVGFCSTYQVQVLIPRALFRLLNCLLILMYLGSKINIDLFLTVQERLNKNYYYGKLLEHRRRHVCDHGFRFPNQIKTKNSSNLQISLLQYVIVCLTTYLILALKPLNAFTLIVKICL